MSDEDEWSELRISGSEDGTLKIDEAEFTVTNDLESEDYTGSLDTEYEFSCTIPIDTEVIDCPKCGLPITLPCDAWLFGHEPFECPLCKYTLR